MKNLHKFFNRADLPWVAFLWEQYYNNNRPPDCSLLGSFWWKDNLKLLDLFKGFAKCQVGKGNSAFFWTDMWQDRVLHLQYPQLFSFARNEKVTVAVGAELATNQTSAGPAAFSPKLYLTDFQWFLHVLLIPSLWGNEANSTPWVADMMVIDDLHE